MAIAYSPAIVVLRESESDAASHRQPVADCIHASRRAPVYVMFAFRGEPHQFGHP